MDAQNSTRTTVIATVPFPSKGIHRCRLQVKGCRAAVVGVVSSPYEVLKQPSTNRNSEGHTELGWAYHGDGDLMHAKAWHGGDYGRYSWNPMLADIDVEVDGTNAQEGTDSHKLRCFWHAQHRCSV